MLEKSCMERKRRGKGKVEEERGKDGKKVETRKTLKKKGNSNNRKKRSFG